MCFLIYTVPFDPQVNPVMHSWNSSPHLTQEEKEHKVAQLIRGREFANLGHLLLDQCSFICTMEGFKVFPSRMIMFPSLEKQGRGKIGIIFNYLSHHLVPLGFLSKCFKRILFSSLASGVPQCSFWSFAPRPFQQFSVFAQVLKGSGPREKLY